MQQAREQHSRAGLRKGEHGAHCRGPKICTRYPQTGFWARLCTGSGDEVKQLWREREERKEAGIRDAHAQYLPGEVVVPNHVPRDG